jgi:hypothetical protein
MPRQIRDVRLQTREARQKLAPAKEPYWREIPRGLHVGYYKGHGTGTWWLREIREGRRAKRRVGLADDHVPADGRLYCTSGAGERPRTSGAPHTTVRLT